MSFLKRALLILIAIFLLGGFVGCESKKEGPAERAGKKIDKFMEDTKKKLKD